MKDKYMRQVYVGTIGDMKNLEQHFSEMAEKGWLIDKIGVCIHRYRAVKPCKKRFFVDFLPQITAFDHPENEDALDYRRICEDAGWNFIAANRQLHVFCADADNETVSPPVPIHTDNSLQAKIYLKACRKYELPTLLLNLFNLLMLSSLQISFIGIEIVLVNISLFTIIGLFLLFVGYSWTVGFTIRWYIRTRNCAKNDLPMPPVSRYWSKWRSRTLLAGAIAFFACIIIGVSLDMTIIGGMMNAVFVSMFIPIMFIFFSVFCVMLWLRRQIDTKRRTRSKNIVLTVVITVVAMLILNGGVIFTFMTAFNSPSFTAFDIFDSDSLGSRPALRLSDVGVSSHNVNSSVVHSSTLIRGSVAVPVNYSHWETSDDGSGNVNTHVYRAINRILARRLYNHFSERFIERFSWHFYFSNISVEDVIVVLSPEEAAFWGAEEGIAFDNIHSDAIEMILLNGSSILQISANGVNMDLDTVSSAVRNLWN